MAITTNDKNLGHATAYAYAKSKGYTGTEEEFAELMASYATVAESAEESRQAAEVAQGKAEDAQAAAETAQGVAEQAKDTAVNSKDTAVSAATTATTKAGEASALATSASSSASAAAGSATSAASSASAASGSAAIATTKAGEASNSATAAATAQTAAEDAQEAAEQAASSVSASAAQIDTNTADINDLKSAINSFSISNVVNVGSWYQGTISTTTGSTQDSTTRCRTDFIQFDNAGIYTIVIIPNTGYKCSLAEYSTNNVSGYIGIKSAMSADARTITIDPTRYYKFIVGDTTDANITPSDVDSDAVSYVYKSYTDKSLTLENIPADAISVGNQVRSVKEQIDAITDYFSYKLSLTFSKIYMIGASDGVYKRNDGNKHIFGESTYVDISTPTYVTMGSDDYEYRVYFYNSQSESDYLGNTPWTLGSLLTHCDGSYNGITYNYVRFNMRKNGSVSSDADTYFNACKENFNCYQIRQKTNKKEKVAEFERFTITNDRSWGAIGVTTAANVEPQNPVTTKCIIALPETYTPVGKPVPLIMFGHGAGGYITDDSWYGNSGNFLTMIRAFTNAGFAVFDVDNTRGVVGGFPDWGCLPLMTAYVKAWQYIQMNYNVQHDLFIVSDSMGTTASLNMLKWYGNRVRTAIQIAPRPISKHRYSTMTDEVKKKMLCAYGIEPDSILTDDTFVIPDDSVFTDDFKGFFHWENIVENNGVKTIPNFMIPPIKVLVGAADTDFLTETREYYAALRNSGNYVDYREVAGAAHNISFLPNYSGLTAEAVNWLKRFII